MHPKAWLERARAGPMALLAALALGACNSVPPPEQQLAAADVAVRNAEEAPAAAHAPAPLRRAQDKLEQARAAMQEEEYVLARRLAEQAEVDAELAAAEARAELGRQNVEELRKSIEALRREAEQSAGPS